MQLLLRYLSKPHNHQIQHHHHHLHRRSLVDLASIKHVRDRGLDHAVERESHLKPVLNLKDLIKQEPSKSLPISVISQQKDKLSIPTRPIEFIRRYPSIFEEFLPGGIGILPHIKLTPQVIDLDAEEQLVYQTEYYRQESANRLLKLLMISRTDKIPLEVIDLVKFDLGLSQDFVKSLVPEFPDCFRVTGTEDLVPGLISDRELELVCWNNELAVSVLEKKAKNGKTGYEKGSPFAFPMHFSTGFEMDKKLKTWLDDWQKLPYISPYENAKHLGPNTDESDKWIVGVLHEILNMFVAKKVERDTLSHLGEFLGVRSRFKRAFLHHPGIFYLSNKMGDYTVVLKDAYKRGSVIEKSPMMDIRNQYVHLMNTVVKDHKVVSVPNGSKQQEKMTAVENKEQGVEEDSEGSAGVDEMGSDFEDDSDDSDDEYENCNDDGGRRAPRNAMSHGRRGAPRKNLDVRGSSRNASRERSVEKHHGRAMDKGSSRDDSRTEEHQENNLRGSKKWTPSRNDGRERSFDKHHGGTDDIVASRDYIKTKMQKGHGNRGGENSDIRGPSRKYGRERSDGMNSDIRGPSRNYGRERSGGMDSDTRGPSRNYGRENGRERSGGMESDIRGPSRNYGRERSGGMHSDIRGPSRNYGRENGRERSGGMNSDSRGSSRNYGRENGRERSGGMNSDVRGPSRNYGRERSGGMNSDTRGPSKNYGRDNNKAEMGNRFGDSSRQRSPFPKRNQRSSTDKRTTT